MLRWNQILRELVARFNLPPAPKRRRHATRSRTRSNPFADPQFPFSNPPYAARAYSYVSVAQYEALKVGVALQVPVQPALAVAAGQRRSRR